MRNDRKNIQKKVADAILQTPFIVRIGEVEYKVAPPSIATLIRVSELISTMRFQMDKDDILNSVLRYARECRVIGDIVALIILGIKGCVVEEKVVKKRWWGLWKYETVVEVDKQKELSEIVLNEFSPNELKNLLAQLLTELQVSAFFGLTASLVDINLLETSGEAVKKKTKTSGQ